MTTYVNIVTSDNGWILERLAKEITIRLPYVQYSDDVDPGASIQYYVTYSRRMERVSPIEVAYFAHLEKDPNTAKKFFDVARGVDFCTCHANIYEQIIRNNGIKTVTTISPGVDLEKFMPRLQLGVVGRTYRTGRKGEHLVAQLMDLDWIDWHFTGEGWPGPALNLPADQLPNFYRRMDYILVPALYEGGPMCVAEALACGTEVIAPPIGWVPNFPHIEYETGDAADLRRVLIKLFAKKQALRQSVANVTWDAWAEGHDRLFRQLRQDIGMGKSYHTVADLPSTSKRRAAIVLHGSEGTDKGGPSVRAPRTAQLLTASGFDASLETNLAFDPGNYDLLHIFNLWHPDTCRRAVEYGRKVGKTVVLSSIFLDLTERDVYHRRVKELFSTFYSLEDIDDGLRRLRARRADEITRGERHREPFPSYFASLRDIVEATDHIIFLSEHERSVFNAIGIKPRSSSVVHNPINSHVFSKATPDLFREAYGVQDYVLCVGRLETRKNQLMLIHALRDTNIPVVLVGHGVDKEYSDLLCQHAGPNVTFIDRLPANSPILASAFAGARVFCLPSWAEGAPLSALEAAASGCTMVLSDRSSEREYFSTYARYCDPSDPDSIRKQIVEAHESPLSRSDKEDLKRFVAERFSWDRHINGTCDAYEAAMQSAASRVVADRRPQKIYVDLTSSANRKGPPSGIARVEETYAMKLLQLCPEAIEFTLWNGHYQVFIPITFEQFYDRSFKVMAGNKLSPVDLDTLQKRPYDHCYFEQGSILLVLGGAWIRNQRYIQDLRTTADACRLPLISFVHDVIQAKFPHWFPANVGTEFTGNCVKLIETSDFVIANSQCTINDTREFCEKKALVCPPMSAVRFGDEITDLAFNEDPDIKGVISILKGNAPFILCVSAIDARKNHRLLHDIWRRMIIEHGEGKVPHLFLVGSMGWNIEWFVEMLKRDELVKGRIHVLHGINDATLDWLYRRAKFTVYPSLYEGWGLPVAESLAYGKVCVAGKAGSVPEICPELTDLLDPYDFTSWYERICAYSFNKLMLERREAEVRTYRPTTWMKSARELLGLLQQPRSMERRWPSYTPDQEIVLARSDSTPSADEKYLAGGWYEPELRGVWTAGQAATLLLRPRLSEASRLVLIIKCRGYVPPEGQPAHMRVLVNGVQVYATDVLKEIATHYACVPSDIVRDALSSGLRIDIEVENPRSPREHEAAQDSRLLGVMVHSLLLRREHDEEVTINSVAEQLPELFGALMPSIDWRLGAALRNALSLRPDVARICAQHENVAAAHFFLWCWTHGRGELTALKEQEDNLLQVLSLLHSVPQWQDGEPDYSRLLHLIWRTRRDLQDAWDTRYVTAQQQMRVWFKDFGIHEYGIPQLMNAEPLTAQQLDECLEHA